ncbi:ATP-dependent DNA helicase RecQ [Bacillus sp. J14TS2]|uniref:helix-turn-helix domain-containing protein n=1 Tax=Bacillus sp. J14TS2 TaxID=2807188 RepID=UPI001AFF8E4E|nr:helix-turn-helix domain-containing protein [Bacillus sp. J14TS2]GIN73456.1 ATP-dependent DNA helicase RecQ [Bacillus sp. J14TS2]
MTFLSALLLKCLRELNGERTIYSIYHLLVGKKSSQTLQDAHLFDLAPFFKTIPDMRRSEFDHHIQIFIEQQYIEYDPKTLIGHITDKGSEAYLTYFEAVAIPNYVNGLKFQDAAIQMWKRLTLFVQVLSYMNHAENRYYPVTRDHDIQTWVKSYLFHHKEQKGSLAADLHEELSILLTTPFPEDPVSVIWRLSGYQMIGYTDKQTAEYLNLEQTEYHFRFLNALHYWITQIVAKPNQFRIMHSLVDDVYQSIPLTNTAAKTAELLAMHHSVEKVACLRNLKKSTIEDHIIEIAMNDPAFSIEPFIDFKLAKEIVRAARHLQVKKLKPIKEQIDAATYFQIRLALARIGGEG